MSILKSFKTVLDAGKDFRNSYDALYNNFYQKQDLSKADAKVKDLLKNADVNKIKDKNGNLIGSNLTMEEYLKSVITSIDSMNLTTEQISLLNSDKEKDLLAKISLEKRLKDAYGAGAEVALNYKDSIKLVAEAMATSKSNIKDWKDSFKTDAQLADDMAKNQSYTAYEKVKHYIKLAGHTIGSYTSTEAVKHTATVAKTYKELNTLFDNLKGGIGGLTDSEKEFLDANKALIDSNRKVHDELLKGWIDSLDNASTKISNIADTLRRGVNKLTVQDYYSSMSDTKKYLSSGDYDKFQTSLDKTISSTSALKDKSNFSSSRDMQFAQLVSANQFDNLNIGVSNELETMKKIAKSTSDMYQAQLDNNKVQEEQANEIRTMRKEIQDQNDYIASIAEKVA